MGFIGLLISKWRIIVLGLLLIAMAGMFAYIEILKLQKSELSTENKSLTFQLQSSQANVKALALNIDVQNAAIEQIKKEGEERVAKNAEALKKAKLEAEKYKKQAADYMGRKPPEGKPICEAADDLFNEAIRKNAQ